MYDEYPRPHSTVRMHPVRAMLFPFPFVCFVAALATDLAYWRTANIQWETFSVWLLAAGLTLAGLGIVVGGFDFFRQGRDAVLAPSWLRMLGTLVALVLSLANVFVHSRDGYTAVVPTGVALSAIVVLILILTNWNGVAVSYRHAPKVTN